MICLNLWKLRKLDIPLLDIKEVLKNNSNLQKVLEKQRMNLEKN